MDAVVTLQLSLSAEDDPEMSNLTPVKQIKLKGAAVTKQSTEIVTLVTIESVVPKMTKVFHIWKAFISLMTKWKAQTQSYTYQ
eukprot:12327036-Ditylum_brightwellii.AAC.1